MTNYEQGYYFEISLCIYVFFVVVIIATLFYNEMIHTDLKSKIIDLKKENRKLVLNINDKNRKMSELMLELKKPLKPNHD